MCLDSIPRGLVTYGVEGSWPEGPSYWQLVTALCLRAFFAALQTSLGNDYGLSASHGVDRAGRFRIYTTGPTGKSFDFGDSTEDAELAPEMFWLAKRFANPAMRVERAEDAGAQHAPERLRSGLVRAAVQNSPTVSGVGACDAIFRGADPDIVCSAARGTIRARCYLAVKGGDNKAPHAHLDLGSFVMDAGGVRWAADPGTDDYELPGYVTGKQRVDLLPYPHRSA